MISWLGSAAEPRVGLREGSSRYIIVRKPMYFTKKYILTHIIVSNIYIIYLFYIHICVRIKQTICNILINDHKRPFQSLC